MRLEFDTSEAYGDWKIDNTTPTLKFIHHRWPLFITETSAFDLRIKYFVSKKTIYQEYSFKLKERCKIEYLPKLSINANLLIRNLNYVEPNKENDHTDEHYSYYEAPDNSFIIRKYKPLEKGSIERKTVGLVIRPFVNDRPYNIQKIEDPNSYQITPGVHELQRLQNDGKMVVTIAYTLVLMESDAAATQSSSQAEADLLKAKSKLDTKFGILPFTKEKNLNFILERNLEHILSVCSIPIRDPSEADIVPIALTCGDVSNHRVVAASSLRVQILK